MIKFLLPFFLIIAQQNIMVIDPANNANTHNQRGLIYLKEGYALPAIQEFKLAIRLCPNSSATATFYNNLGLSYIKIRRYDWALWCFEKSISINPNFIDFYSNLVKVYKLKKCLYNVEPKNKNLTKKIK